MAQQIGQALKPMETRSPKLLDKCEVQEVNQLVALEKMTVKQRERLKSLALKLPTKPTPVTIEQFGKHFQFLSDAMPSKNIDDDAAQRKATVYFAVLGEYSDAAIKFMTLEAVKRHEWFPSVSQCLKLVNEYRETSLRDKAMVKVRNHADREYEMFASQLRAGPVNQEYIDNQTTRFKEIAETQILLWNNDGQYTQRFKNKPNQQAIQPDDGRSRNKRITGNQAASS